MAEEIKTGVGEQENQTPPPPPPPPIPGSFTITIAPDCSDVWMELRPPQNGGLAVTEDEFRREMATKAIRFGIDDNAIHRIFAHNMFNSRQRIAQWKPAEDGVDGTIKYVYVLEQELKPKEDEKGFVDYRDLGLVHNIEAGQTIANITLPTEGQPGTDVMGRTVNQKKGVAAKVSMGENVGLSGDGTVMLALASGNLKNNGGKYLVETVINIRGDVDMTTGNIDFIGDVNIHGEVMEGFVLISRKGNITVNGNCTSATLEAQGNITIKKGCLNSTLTAKGDVKVDFVESSKIHCEGNVTGDIFLTSEVYCGGSLNAQGTKGRLMGGKYTSLGNIQAGAIGSKNYAATFVTIGGNAVMMEEKAECQKKIGECDMLITRYTQAIDFLNQKKHNGVHIGEDKEELLTGAVKSRIVMKKERSAMEKRVNEIDEYLKNRQNLTITCKRHLYPGVKITLNDMVMNVNSVYQHCKVYMGDDGIKIDLL